MSDPQVSRRPVTRVTGRTRERRDDALAVERPLELVVDAHPLVVTLRTPGHDDELALGFLAGEGLIARRADVAALRLRPAAHGDEPDRLEVELASGVRFDWARFERHFAATAACGLCGRAHLDALRSGLEPLAASETVAAEALLALPMRLRVAQLAFDATGGLHAAAWCGWDLAPRVLREDVGRHNAVDKVVGARLEAGAEHDGGVLWVSGRAGAELALKAARARIPVLAAVGAPSTLAVELAEAAGLTLVGFLRDGRMNVYCGDARIA